MEIQVVFSSIFCISLFTWPEAPSIGRCISKYKDSTLFYQSEQRQNAMLSDLPHHRQLGQLGKYHRSNMQWKLLLQKQNYSFPCTRSMIMDVLLRRSKEQGCQEKQYRLDSFQAVSSMNESLTSILHELPRVQTADVICLYSFRPQIGMHLICHSTVFQVTDQTARL